ncbi:type-F conjugative transfer system secretin TraK [Comamonadaceae bacterium G21597-S1]|nr:type-F conjugative transfer system secretin TraK [Comamonadaceae bacterium G21597-S1]
MPPSDLTRQPRTWPATRLPAAGQITLLAACLALSPPGHALQLIDAVDGVAAEAIMSIKEPTRIRIDGTPITDVFGSVYSSHCASPSTAPVASTSGVGTVNTAPLAPPVNPQGEVVVECDRDKGEIYVRPVGTSSKPVNLFISSASATYTLLLHRSDTPADTIVIRDRSQRLAAAASAQQQPPHSPAPAPAPIKAMKALLLAMTTGQAITDYQAQDMHRPVQLRPDVRLTQVSQYQGRHLIGEKYLLHNAGTEPITLTEQEFDRDDAAVTGVAIEQHTVAPGASTTVYVMRRGGTP